LHALPDAGVLVLEDVADGRALQAFLLDGERADAIAALERMAHALGLLHASTAEAGAALTSSGPSAAPAFRAQADSFRAGLPAVRAFVEGLGLTPAAPLGRALEGLADRIAGGGPDCTVTHGDLAPGNVLLEGDQVVFIDLEFCGVRHPFSDATIWRGVCAFPGEVSDLVERRYRRGLAQGGWQFSDERFDRDMVQAASHRLFWMLGWPTTAQLLDGDRPLAPTRALVLHALAEYLRFARARPHEPVLTQTAQACLEALAKRWPETSADAAGFPAFTAALPTRARCMIR
jgi:hypothetical protein